MNKPLKTKRKIKAYYPGLISLIFLPLFVFFFLQKKKVFNQERVIEVNMVDHELMKSLSLPTSEFPPNRKYIEIIFDQDEKANDVKLKFAALEIDKLVKNGDTTKGIHFNFSDRMKYRTVVETINICIKNEPVTFGFHKDDIWVLNYTTKNEPVEHINHFICGQQRMTDAIKPTISEREMKQARLEAINKTISLTKTYFISWILFGVMVYMGLLNLIRGKALYS